MREIKSTDAAAGPHGETLGELDAGVFLRVEQVPENSLFRMVWAGRITGCRADAAIFLFDEVLGRELLVSSEAPGSTRLLVQVLGERFGQAVGQRFGHDGIVIVMVRFEFLDDFLQTMPARDRESANMIIRCWMFDVGCSMFRRNKVRQT